MAGFGDGRNAQLDPYQSAFCLEPCQSVRLLAPAGSGKTQSLLWRCLAQHEATRDRSSARFLVLTFTRAARDELRDRLRAAPDFAAIQSVVDVSTLNSWGFRWLKQRLVKPKLVTNTQERYFCMMNVLRPVWEHHGRVSDVLCDSRKASRAARQLMELMDQVKGLGFRHDTHDRIDVFNEHIEWLQRSGMRAHVHAFLRQLVDLEIVRAEAPDARIWEAFQEYFAFWREATVHLYRSGILTFEDQKYWTLVELEKLLLEGHSGAPALRYRQILVDEFQDINTLDLNLLRILGRVSRCELAIVGDDDQAIYEWRGATPEFILDPDKYVGPRYQTHILEVNYRSPPNVVALSQRLIAHNQRRVPKRARAHGTEEAEIRALAMPALEDSVAYVHQEVKRLLKEGRGRIALIGRKRSQIIPYQIVFAGDGISFCAAEDLNVLLSDAFEQLKAMLLLKAQENQPLPFGPDPVEGLLKMCDEVKRYPLNKTDRGKLRSHLASSRPRTLRQALEALHGYRGPLKGRNEGGQMATTFYTAIRSLLVATSVTDSIRAISEEFDGLQKDYGKSLDDIFYVDPPFLYLAEFAERYGDDFTKFFNDVGEAIATLARLAEDEEEGYAVEWKRPLHLMTALRAKGKEFDSIFVLDCNQGVWPSKLAQTAEELEAERRLFYVAITRVRRQLTLLVNERMFGESAVPSQYLGEMGIQPQALGK